MIYKTYKIINKTTNQSQNYIGFVLDGNIEFRNGKQDFIFCINEYPFITYQIGDKIEINLTNAKRFNTNNYHQEIVRITTFRNVPINDYDNQQQGEGQRQLQQQLQAQKQQSLNKMKLGLDTFYNVLEPLEEYIEKSGDFPNFIDRRQVYRKNIQDSEGSLEIDENLFLSNLFIFARTFHGKPRSFMKIIQEDFYKWINAVGITAENCPEKSKHFLIEINNILEGNDEKIVQETRERNEKVEINPWDMPEIFAGLQEPLQKNREQAKALKGRSWNEISEEDRLKGDAGLGKIAYEEIERSISISHQNFRLRGVESLQQTDDSEMEGVESSSSHSKKNQQIRNPNYKEFVDDKSDEFLNINQWEVKEVIYYYDEKKCLDKVLVRKNALLNLDETGYPLFNPEVMIQRQQLSETDWIEIKKQIEEVSQTLHNQVQTKKDSRPQGGGKGGFGGTTLWGSFTVISLIGLVFTRW